MQICSVNLPLRLTDRPFDRKVRDGMSSAFALVRRILGRSAPEAETTLHLDYQPEVDLLFAWFDEPQPAKNIEVEPGVYIRVAPEAKRVVGIEILDCAARFNLSPDSINRSFVQEKLREYSAPALAALQG